MQDKTQNRLKFVILLKLMPFRSSSEISQHNESSPRSFNSSFKHTNNFGI